MSEQGLLIETKSASLETMAVTIQALHVNGKQMTLAVFRQLPESSLFEWFDADPRNGEDPDIYGDVQLWGGVRYSLKDYEGTIAAEWFVFSRDGQLFRCPRFKAERMSPAEIEREARTVSERHGGALGDRKAEIRDRIATEFRQASWELDKFESIPQLFIAV